MSLEQTRELELIIDTGEMCWRKENPSYYWHILDWLCWKQRCKYPILREQDRIISYAITS